VYNISYTVLSPKLASPQREFDARTISKDLLQWSPFYIVARISYRTAWLWAPGLSQALFMHGPMGRASLSNFQETRRIVNSGRWPVHFFVYLAVSSFVKSCKLAASRSLRGASVQEFLIQISRCARTNSIPYDSLELLDSNQLCFHPDSSLYPVRWLQKGGSSSTTAPFGTE
jgi:hypothetical protein